MNMRGAVLAAGVFLAVAVLLVCLTAYPAAGQAAFFRLQPAPAASGTPEMLVRAHLPLVRNEPTPTPGCDLFPADNIWNTRIDGLPVAGSSGAYVNGIGAGLGLKADFGSGLWDGGPIGIPYVTVPGNQPEMPVSFDYSGESDPGPYPIPPTAPIEGGPGSNGDRHVLVWDIGGCRLYELWNAWPQAGGGWTAGSGAVFDLRSNALRPAGWTSADAAGLPILPGLVRYDEVAAGAINHALRFTVPAATRKAYVWPARHYASSSTNPAATAHGTAFPFEGRL